MSSITDACTPANLLREEPRRMRHFGVVQIMIGMINFTFGCSLYFSAERLIALRLFVPWWTGILYIISGALTVTNVDFPSQQVRKFTVIFNFVSAIAAAVGSVLYIISIWMSRSGSAFFVEDTTAFVLTLLFLYTVVEIIFALLCAFTLCKH
uniref:membrane-spanning 4-domains subfamily A member 4D-like n=1 Tax=Pristiophorus japonicus TaxID=55135 RepID=UPI00398EC47F